jgi:preprotein translocase subunit SecF
MNIIKLRGLWYALSALLIGGSIVLFAMFGLKQGIDFTGGSLLAVRFAERPSPVEVQQALGGVISGSLIIQPVGEQDMNIRSQELDDAAHEGAIAALQASFEGVEELRYDSIGPAIGAELREKSWKALLVVFAGILAYIAYTFRKVSAPVQSWKYGVITLITAVHDVVVPIGVFVVLGVTMGMEIGTPFIAALLTILGYSINDTIIVFDRVRENLRRMDGSFEDIVAASLKQTWVRSLNTSMTTLVSLVAIFFFGGESVRDFALALIIGILMGTYSSLFIASPLLITWNKFSKKA